MPVITIKPQNCGKSFAQVDYASLTHADYVEFGLLNALFDAGRPMTVAELESRLRHTRRDIFRAITAQYRHGNVRKGQPVELTISARRAIAAGRMMQVAA